MKGFNVWILMGFFALAACAEKDSDNRFKEKAQMEQEQQSEVERKLIQERAEKMEADLSDRHFFYNAVEGEYVGSLIVGNQSYKIRFTFARSVPPYTGSRIRELSEIENDINNLFFNMQVVQWHPDDTSSAVGCRVMGIRPNMDEGRFVVTSNDCPNLYDVMISEGGAQAFTDKSEKALALAQKIKSKEITQIMNLIGYVQPSSVSAKYAFTVKRVE